MASYSRVWASGSVSSGVCFETKMLVPRLTVKVIRVAGGKWMLLVESQ